MSEREIAALLRQIEGDAQDEHAERTSEELLDTDFDGQAGPSDLLDILSVHVRLRSSMHAMLDDDAGSDW